MNEFKSLEDDSNNKILMHLDDTEEVEPSPIHDRMPDFFDRILLEINENHLFNNEQLTAILTEPKYIPEFLDIVSKFEYRLENEIIMLENCLGFISKGAPYIDFFNVCLFLRCQSEESKHFILEKCLANIEDPNYSYIFASYTDKYPNEDVWPFVLRMNKNFCSVAMNLIFHRKFPTNRKAIIGKIKKTAKITDEFNLLSMLNLTPEEFSQESILEFCLDSLNQCVVFPDESDEVRTTDILKFIARQMLRMNVFFPKFAEITVKIIDEGTMYQKQESLKFLKQISDILTTESLLMMIDNRIIENISDLIDCDSMPSSAIESALFLSLLLLQKHTEASMEHLDVEQFLASLDSINQSTENRFGALTDQIFATIKSFNKPE